jgi:hypothetical protein
MKTLNFWSVLLLIGFMSFSQTNAIELQTRNFTLSMDQDPVSLGWSINNMGGNHSVSNGILMIDSPQYYEFFAPESQWQSIANTDLGWAVETRVKLDYYDGATTYYAGGALRIWIGTGFGEKNAVLDLYPDRIIVNTSPSYSYFMNTMDNFHTYNIEGIGDALTVAVDGGRIFDLEGQWLSMSDALCFGDGSGEHSISEWDYFSYSVVVPEPATMALLGLGALALIRKRRA